MIKDGVYTAKGTFDKANGKRTTGERVWEGITDFLTEGIYGASPASMALSSYNLDYELLGVACEPHTTDSEWDHGALVGQARVSISNTMNIASATRSFSGDGYKKGSSNPVMKVGSDALKHIWPDGQTDIEVKINWIEEIYVPN